MREICIIRCAHIGLRFLRYKLSPWTTLAIALTQIASKSGIQRTHAQIRYMSALSKIDFARFYELLNDLLW